MKEKALREKLSLVSLPRIILIVTISLLILKPKVVKILTIMNQTNGEKYFTITINDFDTVTYEWIHSFEKTPWIEDYSILKDNSLMLKEIVLVGFGAGIPHNEGKNTRLQDGKIIMEGIDKEFDEINWIHSKTALKYIKLNGKIIIKGRDLPHHKPLKLKIEKRFKLCPK